MPPDTARTPCASIERALAIHQAMAAADPANDTLKLELASDLQPPGDDPGEARRPRRRAHQPHARRHHEPRPAAREPRQRRAERRAGTGAGRPCRRLRRVREVAREPVRARPISPQPSATTPSRSASTRHCARRARSREAIWRRSTPTARHWTTCARSSRDDGSTRSTAASFISCWQWLPPSPGNPNRRRATSSTTERSRPSIRSSGSSKRWRFATGAFSPPARMPTCSRSPGPGPGRSISAARPSSPA